MQSCENMDCFDTRSDRGQPFNPIGLELSWEVTEAASGVTFCFATRKMLFLNKHTIYSFHRSPRQRDSPIRRFARFLTELMLPDGRMLMPDVESWS
jgi:hypothetical protein